MLYSAYLFVGMLLTLVKGGDGLFFDQDILFQLGAAILEMLLLLAVHVHCRVRLLDLNLLQTNGRALMFYKTLPLFQLKMHLVHFHFKCC